MIIPCFLLYFFKNLNDSINKKNILLREVPQIFKLLIVKDNKILKFIQKDKIEILNNEFDILGLQNDEFVI